MKERWTCVERINCSKFLSSYLAPIPPCNFTIFLTSPNLSSLRIGTACFSKMTREGVMEQSKTRPKKRASLPMYFLMTVSKS
jgi:hypothetical protein